MVGLYEPRLTMERDKAKGVVHVRVKCDIDQSPLALAMMATFPDERLVKLRCKLYGADPWPDQDNVLYTFTTLIYLPNGDLQRTITVEWSDTVGEGVLDEDVVGKDEIFPRVILHNYLSGSTFHRDGDSKKIAL